MAEVMEFYHPALGPWAHSCCVCLSLGYAPNLGLDSRNQVGDQDSEMSPFCQMRSLQNGSASQATAWAAGRELRASRGSRLDEICPLQLMGTPQEARVGSMGRSDGSQILGLTR